MRRMLLAAAAAQAVCATAAAQEAAVDVAEIVVTAPGPDRAADELIGPVSVIGREALVDRLALSLGDTLDREPGVATTFFGAGASRPVLRGLGAERVQVLTNGIGVIDASAASPDHQVGADGIDAAKIEILRGPAALAYGGQAIGGVVNVIDGLIAERTPDRLLSGEGFAAYSDNGEGVEGALKAQAGAGPLALTAFATRRDFEGYDIPGFAQSALQRALEAAEHDHDHDHEEEAEKRGVLENSFVETQTAGVGLSFVGDRGFFGVALRRQESQYGLPGHGHAHEHEDEHEHEHDHDEAYEHEAEEGEENPFIDLEQTRFDLRGGVDVDGLWITRIAGAAAIVDYAHTEFEAPGEPGTRYESEGVEARLEADTALSGFEGAFGVQITDKKLSAFGDEAFITPTDTQSVGVFAYQTREWDGGFGVEGGLRLERVNLDNVVAGERSFDLVSGSLGLHRHGLGGWFTGAQLAYTERAPNESELFAFGPHLATNQFEVGDANADKERGVNLELAARYGGERLRFGANVFATRFFDFVYLAPGAAVIDGVLTDEGDGLPVFLFRQEDAFFYGGEVSVGYDLADGPLGADWRAAASLDLVEAQLDRGGAVPLLPPLTVNADLDAAWGLFSLGAGVTFAAEQDDPGRGRLDTDGFTTLDLRAGLDLAALGLGRAGTRAFVQARNVTDEEVRHATSTLKDLAPAPGRTVRIGLKAAF